VLADTGNLRFRTLLGKIQMMGVLMAGLMSLI